ncbi:hypothetical protein E2C01_016370 [Portunus trituberculatus]|uniref:Uncharacterized protein n=1 Tax=Portunus trituberculatus TaxID=210409 RepID=A0A5B7DQE0_PORTR|nr:hypothetical protein [Portunus trituberculatus]
MIHHVDKDPIIGTSFKNSARSNTLHALSISTQHLQEVLRGDILACVVFKHTWVHIRAIRSVDHHTGSWISEKKSGFGAVKPPISHRLPISPTCIQSSNHQTLQLCPSSHPSRKNTSRLCESPRSNEEKENYGSYCSTQMCTYLMAVIHPAGRASQQHRPQVSVMSLYRVLLIGCLHR